LCGNTVVCAASAPLDLETGYGLELSYDLGAGRRRCTAGFTLHTSGPPSVDPGSCVVAGGGPFATLELQDGASAIEPVFIWTVP